MNNNEFQKEWKRFLIEIEKSGTQLAKELGQTQQGFNRKIREGTIKYLELSEIVEKYGYSVSIHKIDSKEDSNKELIEAKKDTKRAKVND